MGAVSFSIDEKWLGLFKELLPLQQFVETGTFKGESLDLARKYLRRCFSVELSPELHSKASARFAGESGLVLHLGPSPAFLKDHQQEFAAAPTLFWLDAHWCVAAGTSGEDSQSPILEELQAIKTLHADSVVMIDDARLYLCAPPKPHRVGDWPDLDDIARALFALSPSHRIMVCNDVIFFYPKKIQAGVRHLSHETGVDWLILAQEARAKHGGVAGRIAKQEKKIKKILGKLSGKPSSK